MRCQPGATGGCGTARDETTARSPSIPPLKPPPGGRIPVLQCRAAMPLAPPDWIALAGGRSWMGGGPRAEENPRHEVLLPPFRLARAPVVRADYQLFLDAT